jgi:hypothetical protein
MAMPLKKQEKFKTWIIDFTGFSKISLFNNMIKKSINNK